MDTRTPDQYFDALTQAIEAGVEPVPRPSSRELGSWGHARVRKLQGQIDVFCQLYNLPSALRLVPSEAGAWRNLGEIPGYSVGPAIASAGQATVFEAHAVPGGERVAIKVYGAEAGSLTDEERRRADQEIKSLGAMNHGRILRLLESGTSSLGHPYLVLEYIDGPSLAELIRPSSRHSTREIAQFVLRLAEAVQHAHQAGVVHRDIKPANILLREQGRARDLVDAKPVLIDFGIARMAGEVRATLMGQHPGTLVYMAPEQFDPKTFGDVTEAVDVRGLGLILFELMVGAPAFSGTMLADVQSVVTKVDILHLEKRLRGCDATLVTIALRAMERWPRDRYASAKDLSRDLDLFLRNKPVGVQRPGFVSRSYRRIRRHGWAFAAGLALFFGLCIVGRTLYNTKVVEDRMAGVLDALSKNRAVTRVQQVAQGGLQKLVFEASWPRAEPYMQVMPSKKEELYALRLLNQIAYEARDLDRPRARECATRAREIVNRLGLDRDDASDAVRFEAARSAAYYGRALALDGEFDRACIVMEAAVEQFSKCELPAATDGARGGHIELALTWNNIGNTRSHQGNPRCDDAYQRAIDILRIGAVSDHECRVWLVKALTNRGLHAQDLTVETVLDLHREAVDIAESYVAEVQEAGFYRSSESERWLRFALDYREVLGIALTNWAEALEESGDVAQAIPLMERALETYSSLANALAIHREFVWSEAMAQTDLGNLLALAGPRERFPEALDMIRQARRWYDAALKRWPDEPLLVEYSDQNRDALEAISSVMIHPDREVLQGR